MIRKSTEQDAKRIEAYIAKDYARNYFIALGMLSNAFQDIYIDETDQINSILFHRKSGNLQFICYKKYDCSDMCMLIKSISFNVLISPQSYCIGVEDVLKVVKEGAWIAALDSKNISFNDDAVKVLTVRDLDDVEALYSTVFSGYPKKDAMADKLNSKRGIGFFIRQKDIVSVAQSDFGNVIVGIATCPEEQGKGYAKRCMLMLMKTLFEHHQTLYLQYDNPRAGYLYTSLGFKVIDQVMHYEKR